MRDPDEEIAREAAEKIMLHRPGKMPNQFTLEEIILAAIKKAKQVELDSMHAAIAKELKWPK